MSTKAKGINTEKIYKELQKADLDEQLKFAEEFNEYLNKELDKRVADLDDKKEKYLANKDKINKNGK